MVLFLSALTFGLLFVTQQLFESRMVGILLLDDVVGKDPAMDLVPLLDQLLA
jgi:hypothetical protein